VDGGIEAGSCADVYGHRDSERAYHFEKPDEIRTFDFEEGLEMMILMRFAVRECGR
jgi:hypothetical protein